MDKDLEIVQLIESVKISSSLSLNFSKSSIACRKLWKALLELAEWKNVYGPKVKSFEMPTEDFSKLEDSLLLGLSTLTNLLSCSLYGGRHDKQGMKKRGGIKCLPSNLQLSTCLSSLDLSFNSLHAVPEPINRLLNLKILMLDYNNIESLSFPFSGLKNLEELYLRSNNINFIDESLCQLTSLQILILLSNQLTSLPDIFHSFSSLIHLNIANNKVQNLPATLFHSSSLKLLNVAHNMLTELPIDAVKSRLDLIDVRYNHVVEVCDKISEDERILLEGNVSLDKDFSFETDDYDVPSVTLETDIAEICVDSTLGAAYALPSGIKIVVPNNLSSCVGTIYCNVISKEPTSFKLNPTDQLLSVVLDLTPNGLTFSKPLQITLPYQHSKHDKQTREIVMRVTDLSSEGSLQYEDLQCQLIISGTIDSDYVSGEVTALIDHFSIFGVVSRLVEDRITVDSDESVTLFSSIDTITRLHFPEKSVLNPTGVTVQILTVGVEDVEPLVNTSCCHVSNVLHVTVNPLDTVFLSSITVHLALPSSLIGRSYDKTMLRLIKCPHDSSDWVDITNEVDLEFTTVDVSFKVNSFSKFWLVWKEIMGVARKVYRRAITYKVQFIAMQKNALPSIVFAQCIREDQLKERINQLLETGYFGKDACSVVQELMEGDRFRIKVMGDIRLKTYRDEDKKHLEENVLVRRFHSQYPPEKSGFCKFCIEPISEGSTTVSGYISFYKIIESFQGIPESDNPNHDLGCSVFSKELVHLDDILITLEDLNPSFQLPEAIEHQLHFGELGTGMFKESNLQYIASQIGREWEEIGHYLGIRTDDMDRIKLDHPGDAKKQIFFMLKKWSALHMHDENCITEFTDALKDAERTDLAEKVKKIYSEGVEKFKSMIKRSKGLSHPHNFDES